MAYLFVRLVLWIGLPLLLIVLLVGPTRLRDLFRRAGAILFQRRLDPQVILAQVVKQHVAHVANVRRALSQAEAAEAEIDRNYKASQANVAKLDDEARRLVEQGDELGAKAALFKLNLERVAVNTFADQLARQRQLIEDSRKRLYMVELQLRQYEVGRTILLSQLAQAKTLEQQYDIASEFDPFNAVASWKQAEGLVHEKTLSASAKERVYADTVASEGQPNTEVSPALLESQLAELKRLCAEATNGADAARALESPKHEPSS